jgi:protein-tyrosine phosphatase
MRKLLRDEGLDGQIELDSAGLGDWHAGDPPDERATAAARRRDIVLEGNARQVGAGDLTDYDLILAMDRENLSELKAMAPPEARDRIRLLREFDPASDGAQDLDVPDPYYRGDEGFETVLDLIEAACAGLLDEIREHAR